MGGLVINHNLMAMNAARNLGTVFGRLATSTQRLSSGLRINSAADDAAGLAIRELMRSDIAVINQGLRNAADSISMIQTAEGALSVIDEKLTRMKELAEQAATGTYTTAQREIMDSEYQAMAAEIDRIANATDFNGIKLLDGSLAELHNGSGLKVHFGTGNDPDEDYYFVKISDARATVSTGLQVGGGRGLNDIYTSDALGTTNVSSALFTSAASPAVDGYVGLWYNRTGDATLTAADNPSYLVGFYQVSNGVDSLTNLVNNINGGTAARIGLEFDSNSGGTVVTTSAGPSITVGNTTLAFHNDSAGSVTGDILVDASGSTTLAFDVASAWNAYTSADTYAVQVSATSTQIIFFEKDPGGNTAPISYADTDGATSLFHFYDINLGTTSSADSGYLSMGDESWVTASTVESPVTGVFQLRLAGNDYEADFDIDMLDVTSYLNTATGWAATMTNFTDSNFTETQDATDSTATWAGAHITTQSHAQEALIQLDAAILDKDVIRANLGALQNRLENTMTNLQIQAENLQAAESRISDVDVATEMTEFTRNNIMAQAATAMLAQANSLAALALSLLGG